MRSRTVVKYFRLQICLTIWLVVFSSASQATDGPNASLSRRGFLQSLAAALAAASSSVSSAGEIDFLDRSEIMRAFEAVKEAWAPIDELSNTFTVIDDNYGRREPRTDFQLWSKLRDQAQMYLRFETAYHHLLHLAGDGLSEEQIGVLDEMISQYTFEFSPGRSIPGRVKKYAHMTFEQYLAEKQARIEAYRLKLSPEERENLEAEIASIFTESLAHRLIEFLLDSAPTQSDKPPSAELLFLYDAFNSVKGIMVRASRAGLFEGRISRGFFQVWSELVTEAYDKLLDSEMDGADDFDEDCAELVEGSGLLSQK